MSKENKEPMSLSKKYNIRYTIDGLAWLLYAVVNLIPGGGMTVYSKEEVGLTLSNGIEIKVTK